MLGISLELVIFSCTSYYISYICHDLSLMLFFHGGGTNFTLLRIDCYSGLMRNINAYNDALKYFNIIDFSQSNHLLVQFILLIYSS